jgi:hypothetical protein
MEFAGQVGDITKDRVKTTTLSISRGEDFERVCFAKNNGIFLKQRIVIIAIFCGASISLHQTTFPCLLACSALPHSPLS